MEYVTLSWVTTLWLSLIHILAEYLITEVSNMQLVAMVDKDDVFSSVKQSAEEYKEQTRKPAFG